MIPANFKRKSPMNEVVPPWAQPLFIAGKGEFMDWTYYRIIFFRLYKKAHLLKIYATWERRKSNLKLINMVCIFLIDVDECKSSSPVCDPNAICQNLVGSYHCSCKTGFTGDGKTCTCKSITQG